MLARTPEKMRDFPWADQIEVVAGDATNSDDLTRAMENIDVAYYLMHSCKRDRTSKRQKPRWHARSPRPRVRVLFAGSSTSVDWRQTCQNATCPRTCVRASGSERFCASRASPPWSFVPRSSSAPGSASFEMLRYLTERLPAMITPRWVRTKTQPIAVRDVLRYLVMAADLPPSVNREFDIGGPEVLTYEQMMHRYAAVAGLRKRIILPINLLSPQLSSHWVGLVTPVPRSIARPLVRSLKHPAICRNHDIAEFIPDPPDGLVNFDRAVELALTRIREANVATRWTGPQRLALQASRFR